MVVNEMEMDQGYGYEELITKMEGDIDKGQSGSGSIVSVAGQINGVLAGYPNDVMTTYTETISDDESCHKQKIVGVSQTTHCLQRMFVKQQLSQIGPT